MPPVHHQKPPALYLATLQSPLRLDLQYTKKLIGTDAYRRSVLMYGTPLKLNPELNANANSYEKADEFNKAFLTTMPAEFDLNKLSLVDICMLQFIEQPILDYVLVLPTMMKNHQASVADTIINVTSSKLTVTTIAFLYDINNPQQIKFSFNGTLTVKLENPYKYSYQVELKQKEFTL